MNPTSRRSRILAIVAALTLAMFWPATAAYADPTSGTVTGVVTDASSGDPLAGVTVTVQTGYGLGDTTTWVTGVDGSYTATGLAFNGSFNRVSASSNGYGTGNVVFDALTPGSPSTTVDVALPLADAAIHGTISDASTHAGIAGVRFMVSSDSQFYQVVTNADGTFSLPAIVPSSYSAFITPTGYLAQAIDNIVIGSGDDYELNASLVPADATISGRVTDTGGNGIEGLFVSAAATANSFASSGGITDSGGNYSIDGVGAGSWDVTVGGPSGGPDSSGGYWSLGARTLSVVGGGSATADFQLDPVAVGSVSGVVLDAHENPVAGICVTVVDPATGDFLANTTGMNGTDTDGYFSSDAVPVGVETLRLDDCGSSRAVEDRLATSYLGDGFNRAHATTFTLTDGGAAGSLVAHVTLGGVIRGTSQVRTPDGSAPLPGSRVLNVRPNLYQKVDGSWEQIPYDSPYFGDGDGYVMFGLPPVDLCVGFVDTSTGVNAFSPTYFSGASSCDSADLVTVTPGSPVDGVTALLSIPRPGSDPIGVADFSGSPEGGIGSNSQLTQGEQAQINVGAQYAGEWLSTFGHSTPTSFGSWSQVSSTGTIAVTVPRTLAPGAHSLVVQTADGNVLGWNPVTVLAGSSSGSGAGGTGSPVGPGSGRLPSTGSTVTPALTLQQIIDEYGAATADLLAKYLKDTGKTVPPHLSDLIANGGGDGLDLSDFTAWLTWSSADTTVSVYGYSTPTYLGRFPVVDGTAHVQGIDLTKLGDGSHDLLIVGDQSGQYRLGAFEIGSSPSAEPTAHAAPATIPQKGTADNGVLIGWVIGGVLAALIIGTLIAVRVSRSRRV